MFLFAPTIVLRKSTLKRGNLRHHHSAFKRWAMVMVEDCLVQVEKIAFLHTN